MKKYILFILLFFCVITSVKAEGDIPIIDSYVDNKAYSEGELVTNSWGYDLATDKYVKIDNQGFVTESLDDTTQDPDAKRGTITVKANVPKIFEDKQITVRIYAYPHSYVFNLKKDNNFTVSQKIIVGNYEVSSISVDETSDYPINHKDDITINENESSSLELDYSLYNQEDEKKEKEDKIKQEKLISYGIIAVVAIILLIVLAIVGIKVIYASNLY